MVCKELLQRIDKVINGTVNVVDYESTDDGEFVENHMWIGSSLMK
ncbi:DUF1541 domain-containing protein [Listeria innocua]|nr:DUF1541 domain-containing protein [Enterococcus lactis]EKD8217460.1 DUF1541 domain-containing protein [Listeria innocua]